MKREMASGTKRRATAIATVLLLAIYVLYVWDRFVYGVELPQIMKALGLQLTVAGFLASVFTLGLAIMAIPGGFISVKFGNRWTLLLGTVLFSLFTALTGLAIGFSDTLLYRIGGGVGEGLYNVAIFTFLGSLTIKRRGTSIGVGASLFGIGGFTGPIIAAYSFAVTGDWRVPFFVFGGTGLVGAVLIYFLVKPSDVDRLPQEQERLLKEERGEKHGLAALNGKWIIPVSITMLAAGLAQYSYISVYSVFLQSANRISVIDAGFIIGLYGIGNIVGGAPMGYVADRIGRRWAVGAYAVLLAIVSFFAYGMGGSVILYGAAGFIYGAFVNALYTNSYATIQEILPPSMMSVGTGYVATLYFLMGAVSGYFMTEGALLYGWLGAGLIIVALPSIIAAILTLTVQGHPIAKPVG